MENNLIVVSNIFSEFKFNNQNILSIRHAAHRWGCDFLEITHEKLNPKLDGLTVLGQTRFRMMTDFNDYEKVLIVDPDIVINSTSPNIFDELTPEYDLAVVKDGNPGRFQNYDFKSRHVDPFVAPHGIDMFEKYIIDFNFEKYIENYFNIGVFLFRPKQIFPETVKMINLIHKYPEFIEGINKTGFIQQNLINAWFTFSNTNIKILDNTWNWIAPDIHLEFDMFMGKMIPNIYHFCGTNLAKERMNDYQRWL